ncbi:MAG: Haloacid dehalogenase, type II, partial [uncultured Thermomicrobiales bacterium]
PARAPHPRHALQRQRRPAGEHGEGRGAAVGCHLLGRAGARLQARPHRLPLGRGLPRPAPGAGDARRRTSAGSPRRRGGRPAHGLRDPAPGIWPRQPARPDARPGLRSRRHRLPRSRTATRLL